MKSTFLGALVLGAAVVGCGSSGGTGGAGGGGTVAATGTGKTSTSTGTKTTSATGNPQTGSGGTGGAAADNTAGKACTMDSDCDVTMMGNTICNNGTAPTFFTNGELNPTAVCQPNVSCDLGDGMTIQQCDGTAGICLETATAGQGLCLGACEFDDTGAITAPCAGKNLCNVEGYGTDTMTMKPFGVGYCLGGCLSNADCTATGETCNPDNLLCETTAMIVPATKPVGTPCVSGDTACECGSNTTFPNGFCITSCKTGVANGQPGGCTTGFECTTGLPTTGTTIFTHELVGATGLCIATCTADTDCKTGTGATNGNCYNDAGHTNKTCHLGPAQ